MSIAEIHHRLLEMEGGIDLDTPFDYVELQIFPCQNRYDAYVCSNNRVEKAVSGTLKQLLLHSPRVKDLSSKGANTNFKILPPDNVNDAEWFTAATLRRFLHLLGSPNIISIGNEITQLEETRKFQVSLSMKAVVDIRSSIDSKNELLRAVDLRLTALKDEVVAAFDQVTRVKCSTKDISDLENFAHHFGAKDIRYWEKTIMANTNIVLLKDLQGYKRNCMIKVKVATLWRKLVNGTQDQVYRIDMILMDEMGTMMYCSCYKNVLHNFEQMLKVDATLYISNPSVSRDPITRYVKHEHKLGLSGKTTVKKCHNWEGLRFSFNFANFKSIVQKNMEKNTIIDFIGYVKVCYQLGIVPKKNGVQTPKINFKLLDLQGTEVEASLWEDKAIQMEIFMNDKNRDKFVFIIVQFGQVSEYEGKMTLSNSFDASRVFINDDIEELIAFKKEYTEKFLSNESSNSSDSNVGTIMITRIEDEFLNNCTFTLTRYIPSILIAKKVIVVATITEIANDLPWYYKGCSYCKCKIEKVFTSYEKDDGSTGSKEVWKCTNIGCKGVDVFEQTRFRILLKVKDCSDTTTITLFDYEAKKILGKSAQDFLDEEEEMLKNDVFPPTYPKEFEIFIGRKYAFIIKVSNYNITNKADQYGIFMLTQENKILDGVYKKFNIAQLEERYSNEDNEFSDMESTNEDVTKSGEEDSVELSHNDDDVCEIEDPHSTPPTKRQKLTEETDDNNQKIKLLIPKIEKN